MTRPAIRNIEELSWAIASQGIAALEPQVADIVAVAQEWEIDPVLTAVLEDRTAPDVARERAFGAIAASLAHHAGTTGSTHDHHARVTMSRTRRGELVG